MPRKAAAQQAIPVELNQSALADANNALTEQSKQALRMMHAYGVTQANPDALIAEIKGLQTTAGEAMFGIGARLMLLRQLLEHGEWLKSLERLNMAPRAAQRVMQAFVKFGDPAKGREKLQALGSGKLIELLTLDEETLDVLEAGGDVLELNLDEIASMSYTELRKALREARAQGTAKDKLLEKRGKQIDELQTALERPFVPEPTSAAQTEAEQAQYLALQNANLEVNAAIARQAVVVRDILEQSASEAMTQAAHSAMEHTCQRVAEICTEHNLSIQFEEMVTPAWLADAVAAGGAAAKGKRAKG